MHDEKSRTGGGAAGVCLRCVPEVTCGFIYRKCVMFAFMALIVKVCTPYIITIPSCIRDALMKLWWSETQDYFFFFFRVFSQLGAVRNFYTTVKTSPVKLFLHSNSVSWQAPEIKDSFLLLRFNATYDWPTRAAATTHTICAVLKLNVAIYDEVGSSAVAIYTTKFFHPSFTWWV